MKAKNNNHHTLFITLIIALFVLLIVAFSKTHSYGAELGLDESEVSGNEEIYEDNTEDSEKGDSILCTETDKDDFQISEDLSSNVLVTFIDDLSTDEAFEETPLGGSRSTSEALTLSMRRNTEIKLEDETYYIRYRSSYNYYIQYVLLTSGVTYNIDSYGEVFVGSSKENDNVVSLYTNNTITPDADIYIIQQHRTDYYLNVTISENGSDDPSGNDPDPSGNDPDPSGNDPSGNDPSGGGIELDGDLQTYLINYFGHKDYAVYDSEELFKEKKFFVSRYEYEVLKSLDDIKILLFCNVGILIVILFVGRRKRNAGS